MTRMVGIGLAADGAVALMGWPQMAQMLGLGQPQMAQMFGLGQPQMTRIVGSR